MADTFNSKASLSIDNVSYTIYRLDAVYQKYPLAERLPFSINYNRNNVFLVTAHFIQHVLY